MDMQFDIAKKGIVSVLPLSGGNKGVNSVFVGVLFQDIHFPEVINGEGQTATKRPEPATSYTR